MWFDPRARPAPGAAMLPDGGFHDHEDFGVAFSGGKSLRDHGSRAPAWGLKMGLIMTNYANCRDNIRRPRHAGNARYFGALTRHTRSTTEPGSTTVTGEPPPPGVAAAMSCGGCDVGGGGGAITRSPRAPMVSRRAGRAVARSWHAPLMPGLDATRPGGYAPRPMPAARSHVATVASIIRRHAELAGRLWNLSKMLYAARWTIGLHRNELSLGPGAELGW
jgi:hypothetical protein